MSCKNALFLIGVFLLFASSARSETNIALHKKYTLSTPPSYLHSNDENDYTDLTDGVYSDGLLWCQKTTLGVTSGKLSIVFDLEKEEPICGISYSTAAGHGGVLWPRVINVFTSNDKVHWEDLGDILAPALDVPRPVGPGYKTHRYATNKLKGRGRYVMVVIRGIYYTFCDELEIYRGQDAWLEELKPAYAITNTDEIADQRFTASGAINRLLADLTVATDAAQELKEPYKSRLMNSAKSIRPQIDAMDEVIIRGLFPLNDTHRQIFALNAYILQDKGYEQPFLWHSNRWDNVNLTVIPPTGSLSPLSVHMMNNEVRSEAINITNPSLDDQTLQVTIQGLPEDARVELSEVLTNEISTGAVVSDCLLELDKDNPAILVPAGCTRQVWIRFNRPQLAPGEYKAEITFAGSTSLKASLELVIHDVTFPNETSLIVGGWDYTNCLGPNDRYKSEESLRRNIAMMRDLYCNITWATYGVIPAGAKFDAQGHLLNPNELDFTAWDIWASFWDNPKYYCIFWNEQHNDGKFGGFARGTQEFENAVSEFSLAWVDGLKERGILPQQLVLHIYDEPATKEHDDYLVTWAKAIKKTCPDVLIYNDPNHEEPQTCSVDFYNSVDIMCPNEIYCASHDKGYRDFYAELGKGKTTLWLYACSGPAQTQDAITYYRGQAWHAFEMGSKGNLFWSFGFGSYSPDDCFECYNSSGLTFSPYYCSQERVMHSKHSEALREGVQDYEYLLLLQKRIAELRKQGETESANALQAKMDSSVKKAMAYLNDNSRKSIQNNILDDVCKDLLSLLDNPAPAVKE